MRSLDKFYKYLENHEAEDADGESPPAKTPDANRTGAVKAVKPDSASSQSQKGSRYIIRNGVTVAVPREETAPLKTGPVPKDDTVSPEEESDVTDVLEASLVTETWTDDGVIWRSLPENVQRLAQLSADLLPEASSQTMERRQLIERLLNPLISLEDTARLLGVCTATVRRYANKGALAHQRTIGQQRRFLLSDVLALLESRKPSPENPALSSEVTP